MRYAIRSAIAILVCFATGASLNVLRGTESHTWVPAGLMVCTVLAVIAWRGRGSATARRDTHATDVRPPIGE